MRKSLCKGEAPVTQHKHSAAGAKLCIHMPSYNAGKFLLETVRRIPFDQLAQGFSTTVLFVDNASTDDTQGEIDKARAELATGGIGTDVILHDRNRGYGGSLKSAFAYAIGQDFDYLAVIHSDGQYAPEEAPRLLGLLAGDPEICTLSGSRLAGQALKGNMPVYKYVANHILTFLQNACTGLALSEYHSGYRLYRLSLLSKIPWHELSDDWVVDQEILFVIKQHGLKIAEAPISTHYGAQKSHVPIIGTPLAILNNMAQYLLYRAGLRRDARYPRRRSPESQANA